MSQRQRRYPSGQLSKKRGGQFPNKAAKVIHWYKRGGSDAKGSTLHPPNPKTDGQDSYDAYLIGVEEVVDAQRERRFMAERGLIGGAQ